MSAPSAVLPARLPGLAFVALFACAAQQLAQMPAVSRLGISPLIVGILVAMAYANTIRPPVPAEWRPGIVFSAKTLLRLAVVLYGFRVTVQEVAGVGAEGFAAAAIMLATTFSLGTVLGVRLFRLAPPLALMIAAGSAVCGAAAVLATEPVVRGKPHESAIAVGTVVIFGTLGMLAYPALFAAGLMGGDAAAYGLYAGSSLHEVAHVVAAARAIGPEAAATAIIVKMLRVMMLVPLLALVAWVLARRGGSGRAGTQFPWFAVGFLACVVLNSAGVVPAAAVALVNEVDLFLLTMAMCALGLETSLDKVRAVGARPFVLAACLALWLAVGGYWVAVLAHGWLRAA